MGKAAQRRKASRIKYLVRLSYEDPKRFEYEWEKRLSSWVPRWIADIRREAMSWREGTGYEKEIVDILDEAMSKTMEILQECPESIANGLASRTFSLISNECCTQAASIVDPRLYRFSKINDIAARAKRSAKA